MHRLFETAVFRLLIWYLDLGHGSHVHIEAQDDIMRYWEAHQTDWNGWSVWYCGRYNLLLFPAREVTGEEQVQK